MGRQAKSSGKTKQFRWPDKELEDKFISLCRFYDQDLSVNTGIVKCLRDAVDKWHLPGYARKELKKTIVLDQEAPEIIIPSRNKS